MKKTEYILEVNSLNVTLNNHRILEDISFDVTRDDTVAVIGPNGAGKTVLFKSMLGLLPYQGEIKWSTDAQIGYVPQKLYVENDFPLTVEEFLRFKDKNGENIRDILGQVGFEGKRILQSKLGVLSGGELQRILISFALLGRPNVLLFDEPTAGVDVSSEETVYTLISKLKKERDLTIMFISHELEVVYKYATTVLCLNKEKICYGPPTKVVDKESLEKMYGEEIHFYHHTHSHHH